MDKRGGGSLIETAKAYIKNFARSDNQHVKYFT